MRQPERRPRTPGIGLLLALVRGGRCTSTPADDRKEWRLSRRLTMADPIRKARDGDDSPVGVESDDLAQETSAVDRKRFRILVVDDDPLAVRSRHAARAPGSERPRGRHPPPGCETVCDRRPRSHQRDRPTSRSRGSHLRPGPFSLGPPSSACALAVIPFYHQPACLCIGHRGRGPEGAHARLSGGAPV